MQVAKCELRVTTVKLQLRVASCSCNCSCSCELRVGIASCKWGDQTPFTGPGNLGVVELRVAVASCGTVVVASGNLPVASWDGCSCELLVAVAIAVAIAVAVASCELRVADISCQL